MAKRNKGLGNAEQAEIDRQSDRTRCIEAVGRLCDVRAPECYQFADAFRLAVRAVIAEEFEANARATAIIQSALKGTSP